MHPSKKVSLFCENGFVSLNPFDCLNGSFVEKRDLTQFFSFLQLEENNLCQID